MTNKQKVVLITGQETLDKLHAQLLQTSTQFTKGLEANTLEPLVKKAWSSLLQAV